MTHPGMACVLVVGVGLATLLYYMFAGPNNSEDHNSHGGGGHSRPSRDPPNNSWVNDRPRYRMRNPTLCYEKSTCTICLTDIVEQQIVYILPCRHPFHATCIQAWLDQKQLETHDKCPNCRNKIEKIR